MAIQSFRSQETQRLFTSGRALRFANIQITAERKLALLDAAATLDFLRSPPGNRLEKLGGNRKGQYSIRINDQWRICFIWTNEGPAGVEIVDYHG
ncbi:MAG TPA: type II toxin-antitoxin system RelE/ParE family toxin [Castellaniella sp.]|uniref:type II toxin-antitoxin system RelE/ParE family toxin n=1 Tax=Castellaniella sp. TaxID=1955812 RepID=UPI002EE7FDF0